VSGEKKINTQAKKSREKSVKKKNEKNNAGWGGSSIAGQSAQLISPKCPLPGPSGSPALKGFNAI